MPALMGLAPGTNLGPYEIQAAVGAGGMGQVYRARDTRLDRIVAVKVLSDAVVSSAKARLRLEREARAISSVTHPHICTLYDIGTREGQPFLVMEYLEGQTLAERLASRPLSVPEALDLGAQIARALDKAHRAGMIHRDLKPANVMLVKHGTALTAKLLDFGIAKALRGAIETPPDDSLVPTVGASVTGHGMVIGTLQYMAPEQLEGRDVDGRTDIFAFGCAAVRDGDQAQGVRG
jgi:serine/threonine protein kinase